MSRRALAVFMALGFFAWGSQLSAAERYWVSSTAKNWGDASAWSATSGGSGGASVPESGDNAFFDASGTGNCTIASSISVDLIQVGSGYTGLVVLGSNVTVMAGSVVLDGTLRMGANSKLQLMDSETPLSGTGTLDTATNSPNTVEYRGGAEVAVASATPVSSYSNLTLTPPGGISRSAVFLGNANEQYFDMAAVDSAAGFLYVGSKNAPAKIVKIRLSDYTRVGTLTLASGENDLSPSVVVDSANGFLYAGTRTSPAKVVKIRLSDFTEVGAIALNTGENQLWSATLDSTNGYAYFGTRTSPARIIKIRLSDFTRESAITLASGENEALGAVIDEAAGFAYFGLQTTPAKVVKVRLSDFTAVATLTCNSGEDQVRVGVIDVAAGFAYFGLKTSPGKIVRVKLSDFTRDAVLTMNTGENKLYSGVIDPAGGFAYFGAYTNPGTVIKVKLDDFTRVDAVTFGAGEKELDTAAIDVSTGYAYFMTDNWTGKAVKVNLNYVGAEWTHPSALDVNGNLTIGAGTLTSAGQDIALAGNWSNAGTFKPGLSTVTLDGGNQAVNGNNTFRNLTKTVTSAATLTFESGKAQQIAGTLNLQGVSGNLLSLRASSAGQSWRLVAENYQATRFADIKDTDASEGRSLIALSSTDSGNNQNVLFSSPAQVAITTPASSATSPAWVEGTNSGDVSAVTVTVDNGTPFNAVRLSPTKWFADNASAGGASLGVTLSASTTTHVEVSVTNPFGNSNNTSQDISWTAKDLNGLSYSSDIVRIRKGDSLLLTATGTGTALEIDGHGDGTFEHSGAPGQKFPTLYSATGTYFARAKIDGVEVGSLAVVVIGVDLHGPIACEVMYQREKKVDIAPVSEASGVSFEGNDDLWISTSVKQTTATGAILYIRPIRRGAPAIEARIAGSGSSMLAWNPIDEFTLDISALLNAPIDGNTGVGTTPLIIRPYIPELRFQLDMFASTSTFSGGQSTLSVNTTSFTQDTDPSSGEIVGGYEVELEVPPSEDKYCFNSKALQQSATGEDQVSGNHSVNGSVCKIFVYRDRPYFTFPMDDWPAVNDCPRSPKFVFGKTRPISIKVELGEEKASIFVTVHNVANNEEIDIECPRVGPAVNGVSTYKSRVEDEILYLADHTQDTSNGDYIHVVDEEVLEFRIKDDEECKVDYMVDRGECAATTVQDVKTTEQTPEKDDDHKGAMEAGFIAGASALVAGAESFDPLTTPWWNIGTKYSANSQDSMAQFIRDAGPNNPKDLEADLLFVGAHGSVTNFIGGGDVPTDRYFRHFNPTRNFPLVRRPGQESNDPLGESEKWYMDEDLIWPPIQTFSSPSDWNQDMDWLMLYSCNQINGTRFTVGTIVDDAFVASKDENGIDRTMSNAERWAVAFGGSPHGLHGIMGYAGLGSTNISIASVVNNWTDMVKNNWPIASAWLEATRRNGDHGAVMVIPRNFADTIDTMQRNPCESDSPVYVDNGMTSASVKKIIKGGKFKKAGIRPDRTVYEEFGSPLSVLLGGTCKIYVELPETSGNYSRLVISRSEDLKPGSGLTYDSEGSYVQFFGARTDLAENSISDAQAESALRDFLGANLEVVPGNLSLHGVFGNVVQQEADSYKSGFSVVLNQKHQGLPIFDSEAYGQLTADGQMDFSAITLYSSEESGAQNALISATAAIETAASGVIANTPEIPCRVTDILAFYGYSVETAPGQFEVRPVWGVEFNLGETIYLIDAITNSVLEIR